MASQIDYELWDEADFFILADACYLWKDILPPSSTLPDKHPSEIKEVAKLLEPFAETAPPSNKSDAFIDKFFYYSPKGRLFNSKIKRGRLKAAAAKYQVRPPFLFPDKRSKAAETPNQKRTRKTNLKRSVESSIAAKGVMTIDELLKYWIAGNDSKIIDVHTEEKKVEWLDTNGTPKKSGFRQVAKHLNEALKSRN